MHHPREAVIDDVKFVLVREELLEEVKNILGNIAVKEPVPMSEIHFLCNRLGVL
jgi:hypothetical protein